MRIGTSNANSTGRKSAARRRASSTAARPDERPRIERRALGDRAEDRAAALLERHEFEILSRNFRCRCGELDIVARRAKLLVIAEVRMRSSERFGGAAASVDVHKQRKIILATQRLLQRFPALRQYAVRFDVIVVRDDAIDWLPDAFSG